MISETKVVIDESELMINFWMRKEMLFQQREERNHSKGGQE